MVLPHEKLSLDAFLSWETTQAERHFFYLGEAFAMAGSFTNSPPRARAVTSSSYVVTTANT